LRRGAPPQFFAKFAGTTNRPMRHGGHYGDTPIFPVSRSRPPAGEGDAKASSP
jgi:hypothetical protein